MHVVIIKSEISFSTLLTAYQLPSTVRDVFACSDPQVMPSRMNASRSLVAAPKYLRRRPQRNSFGYRCMTTAAESATLPLAGIRVLDMTRVLAGVFDIVLASL